MVSVGLRSFFDFFVFVFVFDWELDGVDPDDWSSASASFRSFFDFFVVGWEVGGGDLDGWSSDVERARVPSWEFECEDGSFLRGIVQVSYGMWGVEAANVRRCPGYYTNSNEPTKEKKEKMYNVLYSIYTSYRNVMYGKSVTPAVHYICQLHLSHTLLSIIWYHSFGSWLLWCIRSSPDRVGEGARYHQVKGAL